MKQTPIFALLGALIVGVVAYSAQASTLHVENWGFDFGGCGTAAAPCRSIGKALTFAASGDKVLVGPGRYSNDLNGNSIYNEPGEEPSGGITLGSGVTVMSTHGSAATEIEYRGGFGGVAVVTLGANAVFGKKNKGPSSPKRVGRLDRFGGQSGLGSTLLMVIS